MHMKLSHTRKTEGTLPKNIKRGKELHEVARLKKYTRITHGSLFLSLSHGYENGTHTQTHIKNQKRCFTMKTDRIHREGMRLPERRNKIHLGERVRELKTFKPLG